MVTAALFGIGGFFAGREYMKYEIAKAFSDAFSGMNNSSSSSSSSSSSKQETAKTVVEFNTSTKIDEFNLKVIEAKFFESIELESYGEKYKPKNKILRIKFEREHAGKKQVKFTQMELN